MSAARRKGGPDHQPERAGSHAQWNPYLLLYPDYVSLRFALIPTAWRLPQLNLWIDIMRAPLPVHLPVRLLEIILPSGNWCKPTNKRCRKSSQCRGKSPILLCLDLWRGLEIAALRPMPATSKGPRQSGNLGSYPDYLLGAYRHSERCRQYGTNKARTRASSGLRV